jgi:hypothetical protein
MANLLSNLKSRFQVAEKFTKDYHEQVKQAVKDYKAETPEIALDKVDVIEISKNKYKLIYPLIFINHEAMMASLFDRVPELVFNSRGELDDGKKLKVIAAYRYLVDKLGLEWFLNDSAWWFLLSGMATAHSSYKRVIRDVPILDEYGEPSIDEEGKPQLRTVLEYDDPILEVGDPLKEYYSPESEFTYKFDKVPYLIRKTLMTVDEVKRIYKKDVEADATIEVSADKKAENADMQRVQVYFYYGDVPRENKSEVEMWEDDANYYIVYTEKKVLYKSKVLEKPCRGLRLHGVPNEFFGFGLAKLLKRTQEEKSTRRSQQIRYADVMSMPKLAIDETARVDENAINDPRVGVAVLYSEKKPEYLVPPPMPDTLLQAEQKVDGDAQQISGLLDLSTGGQQSMTDKATGQVIFAEAAEKRVRSAKRKLLEYYKEVVIMLLKSCQQNWTTEKEYSLTDEDGQEQSIAVSSEDLKDIDFEKDIDIDAESVSMNKDVIRQQAIEFYNMTKDDPIVERSEVVKDVMRDAFGKHHPEKYITEMDLEPGTRLMAESGEQYVIDDSGKLTPQQAEEETAQPVGDASVPATEAGLQGSVNNLGGL